VGGERDAGDMLMRNTFQVSKGGAVLNVAAYNDDMMSRTAVEGRRGGEELIEDLQDHVVCNSYYSPLLL